VIRGARWFGPEDRPFLLRVEVPLTSEEMVAGLDGVVLPDEMTATEDRRGCVFITLLLERIPALQERAVALAKGVLCSDVESHEFLKLCRKRVAELLA
jgi:hypothetical protein